MNRSLVTKNKLWSVSIRMHRQQQIWQIWLPLVLASLVVIGLAILAIVGASRGSDVVTKWSHFSSILIIIPVLFVSLVVLALVCAGIYGLAKLLKILPAYTGLVQAYTDLISISIKMRSDQLLKPIFAIRGWFAALDRLWSTVRGKNPA